MRGNDAVSALRVSVFSIWWIGRGTGRVDDVGRIAGVHNSGGILCRVILAACLIALDAGLSVSATREVRNVVINWW